MKCPHCNTENPQGARFCMRCGSAMEAGSALSCPICGEGAPANARFCPACAAPLAADAPPGQAPAPAFPHDAILRRLAPREYIEQLVASSGRMAGERRVVTILFFDIKGSTAMAERLDPEDVMEIMNDAFETLIEPIYRYEGTVARIMGDAVLAFFGAPISHEDDAARACRAALEIIDRSREFAGRVDRERGIQGFDVRVGINTGLVVVGEVGSDLRVEYTAMGDAVNLAKRMEDAAEPGTVLISRSTQKLVSELFETEDLGRIGVKGRTEQVAVFRLLRPKADKEPVRKDAGGETRLIGREAELGILRRALEGLREGRGGTFSIIGEAGIGKSRLVGEARRLYAGTLTWAEGRCVSYARDVGCWVARDILERLLDVERNVDREKLDHRLSRLLDIRLDGRRKFQGREQVRREMLTAFRDHVRDGALSNPHVLVWRDLQWIDPSSLELLEILVQLAGEVPLLLILLLRPAEGRIWKLHESLGASGGERYEVIEMGPLERESSALLLERLLDGREVPEEIFDLILDHSEGNAFFMDEVVRSLQDAGLLDSRRGRAITAKEIKKLGIPTTLQGAIMSHVDTLPQQDKRILQTASVLGRVFDREVLARTLDPPIDGIRLEIFLLNLCSRGFLELRSAGNESGESEHESMLPKDIALWRTQPLVIGGGRAGSSLGPAGAKYYFKNPVTAEVTYDSLLKSQRAELHRRAGEAIEEVYPDRREEFAPLLAYHYEKGHVLGRAYRSLIAVARRAAALNAVPEAVTGYRRAIAVAQRDMERITAEARESGIDMLSVHEEFGDVLYMAGEYREAMEQLGRALGIADDRKLRARLRRKMGQVCEKWGRYGEAKNHFEGALTEVGDERDSAEAAYIYAGSGIASYHLGELDEAQELVDRALPMMERQGNEPGVALVCNNLGIICCKREEWARAVEYHRRCMEIYERMEYIYGLAASCNNIGLALKGMGDWEGAAGHFARSLELFEQIDNRHGIARAHDNLGKVCMELGRIEKATEHVRKAFDIMTEISREGSEICLELWQSGEW